MEAKMIKRKLTCILACVSTITLLAGCGKGADYDGYKKCVEKLYEDVVSADAKINNIDYTSTSSKEEFFGTLDKLKSSLEEFSEVDAPKEFDDCEYLAGEAVKYITSAEDDFHKALDNDFDEISYNNGVSNYNEMVKCVNYIGDVLQKKPVDQTDVSSDEDVVLDSE